MATLSLVLSLAPCPARGQQPGRPLQGRTIHAGLTDCKPIAYGDKNGDPRGMAPTILRYVAQQEGWGLAMEIRPWAELLQRLDAGLIDIVYMSQMNPRSRLYTFTTNSFLASWGEVVTRPGSDISSMSDLKEARLAVSEKSVYTIGQDGIINLLGGFGIDAHFLIQDNFAACLRLVQSGQADAAVVDHLFASMEAREYGLKTSGIIFSPTEFHFALSRRNPAAPLLVQALDKHLAALKNDENSIYHKTLNAELRGMEQPSFSLPGWVGPVLGLLVGLFALLLLFSLFLRWQVRQKTKALSRANALLSEDLRRRERMARDLMESREKYRLLADNMHDIIWMMGLDQRMLYISPSVLTFTGYTPQEAMRIRPEAIYTVSARQTIKRLWEEFEREKDKGAKTDPSWQRIIELEYRRKDGSIVWGESKINFQPDEHGRPLHLQGVTRDISERKRAEQARARLEAQLAQSQKMEAIGTLAGGIAHDFNNILASIIGFCELSLEEAATSPRLTSNLEQILRSSIRAKGLIRQILAFSRQSDQKKQPLRLDALVNETLAILRPTLPSTIEIDLDTPPGLGMVMADPTHIQQIVMNLVTNAAHAMRAQGGRISLTLARAELDGPDLSPGMLPGPYLALYITDTGEGIDEKWVEKIFEPYFTTKQQGEGTGLGLAVVHGLVTGYQGGLRVSSRRGEGSTFEVYLPAIEQPETQEEIQTDPPRPGQGRVLFVDDEEVLAELGRQMLGRLGYEVSSFSSSLRALDEFKKNPRAYDLVITDMTMPGLTGDRLAQQMLSLRPDIPILLLTGYSSQIDEEKARAMGLRALMLKPLVMQDLAKILHEILGPR